MKCEKHGEWKESIMVCMCCYLEQQDDNNAVKALLDKTGFSTELTNGENFKKLIDHHTQLVANNTALRRAIDKNAPLLEVVREVAREVKEAEGG